MTGSISVDSPDFAVFERELYATVTISRSGDISKRASFSYTTAGGSAEAGTDFALTGGTAVFGSYVANVVVSVPIVDDRFGEPTERFSFSIVSVDESSTLGAANATVSIFDDESPVTPPGPEPLVPSYSVTATEIAHFRTPISITFIPGTAGALVPEKSGRIHFVNIADGTIKQIADLRDRVNPVGDRGLLGVAFYPDLAVHPYVYVFYVADPPDSVGKQGFPGVDGRGNRYAHLSRFTVNLDGPVPSIAMDSEVILLGAAGKSLSDVSGGGEVNFTDEEYADLPASNINADGSFKRDYIKSDSNTHLGGALAFGADGMLYVSTGDGSSPEFADRRAFDIHSPDSLNGKILRIDPLTGKGLPDNPFATTDLDANRSKVWAMGLRNPYTMTFTPDGRLFAGETGWNSWEEINVITKGGNYGWPFYEGGDGGALLPTEQYKDLPEARAFYAAVESGQQVVSPAYRAFSHSPADPGFQLSCIVGASTIYTGDKYPAAFKDDYFFTDTSSGEIYAVDINNSGQPIYVTDLGVGGPTSLVEGPDGYMYVVDLMADRVLRLNIAELP